MDLFNEIDDLSDLFLLEKNSKLDSAVEGFEDLQSRYSSLHEDYAKEIENSKKVEKSLIKCLKFYSKLSKKYETQQKVISNLEQTVKEKIISLEEAQRNEEKLRGLIQVYRTERAYYAGQSNNDLRKDKEILLDICCRLIGESVRNNNIRNLTNLLIRKFKKDLDDEKLNLLKKSLKMKNEFGWEPFGEVKSDFDLKSEEVKTEKKYSEDLKEGGEGEEPEPRNSPLDLSMCWRAVVQPVDRNPSGGGPEENEEVQEMTSGDESESESSLPLLGGLAPLEEPPGTAPGEDETGALVRETVDRPGDSGLQSEKEDGSAEGAGEGNPDAAHSGPRAFSGETCFEWGQGRSASPARLPKSIFDVSDACVKASDSKSDSGVQDSGDFCEIEFGNLFEEKEKEKEKEKEREKEREKEKEKEREREKEKEKEREREREKEQEKEREKEREKEQEKEKEKKRKEEGSRRADDVAFGGEPKIPGKDHDEEEVFRLVREMSSMRLPSRLSDITDGVEKKTGGWETGKGMGSRSGKTETSQLKRNPTGEEGCSRSKKLKPEEGRGGRGQSGGLLDSIMSAMSLQSREFKGMGGAGEAEGSGGESVSTEEGSRFSDLGRRTYSRRKRVSNCKENSSESRQSGAGGNQNRQQSAEKFVMEEIKNFVSSGISCKEEADRNVKQCMSVLAGKPEEIIAKCIVAVVLENVDEAVEVFERPAPPLTKTQHRLIVLLSVFRTMDSSFDKISTSILSMISQKLFPDNFFWPDDSLEAATRFYAALCRARNEPKTLWRFCLQSMTEMRQRCPLLVFTALKTWPDVLHDAATLKNNSLAVTIVNVFLHMPKTEGLRNFNQGRKLVALKHLLMNFYQFKIEDTIEGYARKVVGALKREEPGAGKSVVLLSKCRDAGWTVKNVVPGLRSTLEEWGEGKAEDGVGSRVLRVLNQVCGVLLQEGTDEAKVKDLIHCLAGILNSQKKSHESEVELIEVLLQLKRYPEARKVIREWIPKSPIDERLRNEIINASAENILRELKLNKEKEGKSPSQRKKMKKQSKKWKVKKKRGKKRKSETRTRAESVGVSS